MIVTFPSLMNRKRTKKKEEKKNNYYHLEDILNTVLKKSIKTETRLQLQESKLKINARNKFHHSSYLTCGGIFNLIPKIIYIAYLPRILLCQPSNTRLS